MRGQPFVRLESGSVLLPVVGAMLILSLVGTSLVELFGAQRMSSVHTLESAQAFWSAEAGIWHAASEETELTTPVSFAGSSYTVSKQGDAYTSVASHGNARREVWLDLGADGDSFLASLIAHWKLDETSGSTVTDSAGSNDGEVRNGTAQGVSGASNGITAYDFDGSDDEVEIPHISDYLLDDGTIQLWFRADDVSGQQGLFSKDSNGYDNGGHVHIHLNGSDAIVRFQTPSSSKTVEESITSGVWYYLAFTFGSEGMSLYLNGALVDTDSYTGGMGSTSGGSGNKEPVGIGVGTNRSGNETFSPAMYPFNGRIDEVAIFNRALSADEVLTIYQAGGQL